MISTAVSQKTIPHLLKASVCLLTALLVFFLVTQMNQYNRRVLREVQSSSGD